MCSAQAAAAIAFAVQMMRVEDRKRKLSYVHEPRQGRTRGPGVKTRQMHGVDDGIRTRNILDHNQVLYR